MGPGGGGGEVDAGFGEEVVAVGEGEGVDVVGDAEDLAGLGPGGEAGGDDAGEPGIGGGAIGVEGPAGGVVGVGVDLVVGKEAGVLAGVILGPLRRTAAAGPSPLWGAFTFPLAALATAFLLLERGLWAGLAVLGVALAVNPLIAWWVLKRWPGGRLAAVTNAAEA